jgi:hypothetical protein
VIRRRMNEIVADMFSEKVVNLADAICLTTNGFVKKNGCCVMGAGNAKQAKDKFKGIDKVLGTLIKENGNIVQIVWNLVDTFILSFPVKHNWWEKADVDLVELSTKQLVELTNKMGWKKVILPRPGCHNGRLMWLSEVKPILKSYLDDRFYIINLPGKY